jgi:2-polyprenyl-3-methyl-5-hydroxy-6-metoxy-1,4-benzoquinol methylase
MESVQSSKPAAPELNLDALMETIRTEVAERKRAAGALAAGSAERPASFDTRSWTARQLIELPAADFARAVHIAFLGRDPTPDEFVRLRDRLLINQVGRMRVLREFRRLPESRGRRSQITGLWREFAWDRLYWSPPAKFGRAAGNWIGAVWRLPRLLRELAARIDSVEKRAAEAAAAIRSIRSAQISDRQNAGNQIGLMRETLRTRFETVVARIDSLDTQTGGSLGEIETRISGIQTTLVDHWRSILGQKFSFEAFLTSRPDEPKSASDSAARQLADERSHLLDPLYLSFEDRYRGSRSDIKDRQRFYLPWIEACYAATDRAPVIDIGCGRGEWLELLSEANVEARGYDLNRIAVDECRARGLEVMLADAIETLASLPEKSCSAVTAFHIVEHLAFEDVVALLDQSLRVLQPGGILIVETPNPANLIVAAEKFYMDPTHRNPLPSELTAYLLKSRGFEAVEILPLHPVPWPSAQVYGDPMLALVQDKLFGPQDYGALARKPA